MIARPKISRNEWKTTEIGAFEVGNFALFSCPGAERRERARYEALLDGAARGGTVGGLYAASGFAWLFAAFGLSYAAAFWFSGRYLFRQGDAAVFDGGGDVIEVFFAAIIGVSSVSDAAMPLNVIVGGLAAGANLFGVLEASSAIEPGPTRGGEEDAPLAVDELRFDGVRFAYPSRRDVEVLAGVSCAIRRGQKVAFVGESGSGKSTVVQLLLRFYDPSGGAILVDGADLRTLGVARWRRTLGYVGQEPVLFQGSILENIRVSDQSASTERCRAAARMAEALDFVDGLPEGFDTAVGQGGGALSGGQKQRVAIARALLAAPSLLLLDEATSALDNASEKLVQSTLDHLQERGGMTTLSVSHRLSTVRNADAIFVVSGGVVAEAGTHAELVERAGIYHKLTAAQDAVHEPDAPGSPKPEALERLESAPRSASDAASEKVRAESSASAAPMNDDDREAAKLKELAELKYEAPMSRIFGEFASKKVKLLFPLALLACCVDGVAMPLQGYVLSEAMTDFYLPYKCPPRCATDDANATDYCWEQTECDDYRPKGTNSPLRREANRNALAFVAIAALQFVGVFSKMGIYRYIQEQMTAVARGRYLAALVKMEIGFFDAPDHSSGALTAALSKQTQLVAGVTGLGLGGAVSSACAILFGLALALRACWRLSLAMLAMIPVIMASMAFVFKLIMGDAGESGGAHSGAAAVASEAVLHVKTVRAARAEADVLARFAKITDAVAAEKVGAAWKGGVAYGLGMAIIFTLYLVVFAFGPVCVDEGWCSPTDMWKALFCIMFGAFGAGSSAIFAQDANKAKIAAFDVFAVLDRESAVDATADSGGAKELKGLDLVFDAVSFAYPARREALVLDGLCLRVPASSTCAFVGPSGSGKSTIIQLVQRFYEPSSGSVTLGGAALASYDVAYLRSILGFVGQEPVLFDASLADNVRYGAPDATDGALAEVAALAKLDFLLDGRVAWTDGLGPRGGRLSGGQKQRVAIARALVRDPKLLLLDEATSALDSRSEKLVQEALEQARAGRTTLVVAHRLSTIEDSDQIVVMVDGTCAESGTHASLLEKRGVYHTLQNRARA